MRGLLFREQSSWLRGVSRGAQALPVRRASLLRFVYQRLFRRAAYGDQDVCGMHVGDEPEAVRQRERRMHAPCAERVCRICNLPRDLSAELKRARRVGRTSRVKEVGVSVGSHRLQPIGPISLTAGGGWLAGLTHAAQEAVDAGNGEDESGAWIVAGACLSGSCHDDVAIGGPLEASHDGGDGPDADARASFNRSSATAWTTIATGRPTTRIPAEARAVRRAPVRGLSRARAERSCASSQVVDCQRPDLEREVASGEG
jgi:hypothetical protein